MLHIKPNMPKEWEGLTFRLTHLNSFIEIAIAKNNNALVTLLKGEPTQVNINGTVVAVK